MELLIKNQWGAGRRLPIPLKRLQQLFAALLHSEQAPPDAEISLVFCGDDFIQELNRDYRQKDQPTDVLSFPQDPNSGVLGDVVLSVPTAAQQATAHGHPLEDEIAWLFLHSLLHLLGYEDETDEQAEEMNERARRALRRMQNAEC